MTKLLIDPSHAAVNATLALLQAAANKQYRARTAGIAVDEETWAEPTGKIHAGGHGVAKAYAKRGYGPQTTTVVGLAWAVGGDGRRYVLVGATREKTWPGDPRKYPFRLKQVVWDVRTPYHLLMTVAGREADRVLYAAVPTNDSYGYNLRDRPDEFAAACLAVLRLLTADGRDDPDVGWLRAYTRLADAADRVENR